MVGADASDGLAGHRAGTTTVRCDLKGPKGRCGLVQGPYRTTAVESTIGLMLCSGWQAAGCEAIIAGCGFMGDQCCRAWLRYPLGRRLELEGIVDQNNRGSDTYSVSGDSTGTRQRPIR